MATVSATPRRQREPAGAAPADVVIKERGNLVIVLRETPFSPIHLENMLKLSRLGVTILPANPASKQSPTVVEAMVDFIVARVLDQFGIANDLMARWGV